DEKSNEEDHKVLGEDAHEVQHAVPVAHEHESSDEKSNEADHKVLGEDAHEVQHAVPVAHEHESSDEKSNETDHKVSGEDAYGIQNKVPEEPKHISSGEVFQKEEQPTVPIEPVLGKTPVLKVQASHTHEPIVIQYYLCNVVNGKAVCGVQEVTLLGISANHNDVMKCYDVNTSSLNNCLHHHGGHSHDMHHTHHCPCNHEITFA
ncbi:hypothetical protein EHRUM2_00320, partial [Ehrlichia ruminantium]